MEKYQSMPEGYMSIGDVAKKMGVTVRTLQYYDKKGLLSPSAESAGGRRLYTDKDVIRLHQILSMKSLGFSLDDIKTRLPSLSTPADVANVLSEQAAAMREKIESLSGALSAVEALKAEVLQMQSVDFGKYADIIINLQMKNELYWFIKHIDGETLDYFRSRFDRDSGPAMMEAINRLTGEAIRLQEAGVPPDSEKGLDFARAYWNMVMEFTGGDMGMVFKLMEAANVEDPNSEWKQKQPLANAFIEPALGAYFAKLGTNPFKEGHK